MSNSLRLTTFDQVDLSDRFFDSLKAQYQEFPGWFARKTDGQEPVYVVRDDTSGELRGFLYIKVEEGPIADVQPPLPAAKRIKVGTLKIVAHGTKLGERVIKKTFDYAIANGADEIYVTVFDAHEKLIRLFERYGFEEKGKKVSKNGVELVMLRSLRTVTGNLRKDYPLVHVDSARFFLLAIYPEYHTNLFPDSILRNEKHDILEDVSHTNTIHKVYIAKLALTQLKRGDVIVIYRTTDQPGRARFRSVATSICVVEEAKSRHDFKDAEEFAAYARPHSVFSEDELVEWYNDPTRRLFSIKMTYNVALPKRPNRDALLDHVGISEQPRWDLRRITRQEFDEIVDLSEMDDALIVE